MCEPTMALMAVSTTFSAYSQIQQGNAQAAAARAHGENQRRIAEYNAKVQENNAIVADRNAKRSEEQALDAVRRGADEAAEIRERVRRINATGRAVRGSSGLLVDEGNFNDVLDMNTVYGEMDAMTEVANAEREAYGFKTDAFNFGMDASNLRSQANLTRAGGQAAFDASRASASNIKSASRLNAADTLVSGGLGIAQEGNFFSGSSSSTLYSRSKKGIIVPGRKPRR